MQVVTLHPAIAVEGLTIRYPLADRPAIDSLDLTIRQGERVLLLGPSGCGKSSLLLALTGLIPHSVPGDVTGKIRLFGESVDRFSPAGWAARVAQFFQNADETLCGMLVEDEIAFGLENRALDPAEIHRRVAETMAFVGLPPDWRRRQSMKLSGGERQMLALAATMAPAPDIFLADEPTAHLAPAVADRLNRLMADRAGGRTSIIVDHRFEGRLGDIDRVVVLDRAGQLIADGRPADVFGYHFDRLEGEGVWLPPAIRLARRLRLPSKEGLSGIGALLSRLPQVEEHRETIAAFAAENLPPPRTVAGEPVVTLQDAACAPFLARPVLRSVGFSVHAGEILGLIGPNGAGKTTLGATLAGLLPLAGGKRTGRPGAIAFQNPEAQFQSGSVLEEWQRFAPAELSGAALNESLRPVLRAWGLEGTEACHPHELSIGQKRRLALAALTYSRRWPLVVLDEPTAGLDARGFADLIHHLDRLRNDGMAIVVITHDADAAARLCDRIALVAGGTVSAPRLASEAILDEAWLAKAGMKPPAVTAALRHLQRPSCPC